MAQVDAENKDVPVRISFRPEKETIMLGEPLYFAFEVTNLSGERLCLGIGGDYRNRFGRPESFVVRVTAEDGTVIPKPEADSFGGLIGCGLIEAGDTYTVKLFLTHWATITRPGSYHVNVKRSMGFSTYDASDKRTFSMDADLNARFTIVPADENKMGAVINSLGSIILDINNPLADDSALALASIQDKRVISYFAEAVRNFTGVEYCDFMKQRAIGSRAIAVLGMYDDDRAIQELEAVMNSTCERVRLDVATAFGDSPHKSAIKLLLKMQDDKYWFVRLRVAQGLKKIKSKESLAALRMLLKDDNEDVRKAAQESLKNKNLP